MVMNSHKRTTIWGIRHFLSFLNSLRIKDKTFGRKRVKDEEQISETLRGAFVSLPAVPPLDWGATYFGEASSDTYRKENTD